MTKPHPSLLKLALALCTAASVQAADLPPPPADAQLAKALVQAQALLEQARSPGYLDMPQGAQPWPCPVTELELRRYAHVLSDDEQDDPDKKARNAAYSNAGMRSNDIKTSIKDVRYAPIAASCKNGKLDGALEFVLESTRITDMPVVVIEMRSRSRIRLMLSGGLPIMQAPMSEATLELSDKTRYKDAATQAMMDKDPSAASKTISASYTQPVNADVGYSAVILDIQTGHSGHEWMTLLNRPTGPKSMELSHYRGSQLWMRSHTKNGRSHGEHRTYPAVFGGVTVPGSTQCYEDGEQIKTTQCNVN